MSGGWGGATCSAQLHVSTDGAHDPPVPLLLASIGKGTGYKASELASLDEGHTLVIGGKEIEVWTRSTHSTSSLLAFDRVLRSFKHLLI